VVMGGQLDEHLLFWQPTISITLYVIYCTRSSAPYLATPVLWSLLFRSTFHCLTANSLHIVC